MIPTPKATVFAPRAGYRFDTPLLVVALGLMALGLVMVYSASIHVASVMRGGGTFYLEKQLLSFGIAIAALVVGMLVPYGHYRQAVYPVLLLTLGLLVVLLIPGIGTTVGRSTRWFRLAGISVQPSEIGKIAFVVWLAYSLEKKAARIRTFSMGLLPHLLVCAVFMALFLLQPDLGVCIVTGLVLVAMLFVAGTPMSYLVALFLAATPALVHAIANNDMRMQRMLAFLDPWEHRYDSAYALVNSMAAMGSGGIFGRGLGASLQKFGYIPEAQTDFIFPVIGEELGLVGSLAVIAAFVVLVVRGLRIAQRARDDFGKYLAFGLTMLFGVQAAVNIGVSMAMLPTKGLTLPLVSYGGSSLVICAFMVGILLQISASSASEEPEPEAPRLATELAHGGA